MISKSILEANDMKDAMEVKITSDRGKIVIEKIAKPRADWSQKFLASNSEEQAFFPEDMSNKFDEEEWTWE
ncbi:AbrB/MazE/SpoVT family DNA-binding domain-containing protein [Sphingobacterium corticis]|uniref:AbrB/MazE/SpoVT family DNA-binding domain-containing protein n=1 Tax=Sphingobacterium corticis TaxID=1812823 RepID=UPI0036D2BDDD